MEEVRGEVEVLEGKAEKELRNCRKEFGEKELGLRQKEIALENFKLEFVELQKSLFEKRVLGAEKKMKSARD